MLELLASIGNQLLKFAGYLAGFFYVRRATKIETERDALDVKSQVQKEQLDIASRPLPDADAVRQRMRDGEL